MQYVEVSAAIIQNDGKTLCVQRGPYKYDYIEHKFEFPGGKLEEGETGKQAVIRELQEELHLEIQNPEYLMTVFHNYPDFQLTMHAYICPVETRDIVLTEHIAAKWLSVDELSELDWAAADLPIVEKLQQWILQSVQLNQGAA